ncbi:hypothetical protein CLV49_2558 [Labedella gwakjiensis]|uniref:Uncharacterized protein n=1 Tax=Labedella gwakjiensis TaxID=390269 RepID=A0A2P8GY78_9MICO|nr:hypothetical protein [Labedella gwakjiensis]PSL38927.1 hypothetical protein CLV49_2558 [Labedella gwakjiensis]RUQ86611.1 hypothetical protein ELQ93_06435 [Labedella gwakjiensis]
MSRSWEVPVVVSRPFVPEEHIVRLARGDQLDVVIAQHRSDQEPWIAIAAEEAGGGELVMSLESADRLARTILETLVSVRK